MPFVERYSAYYALEKEPEEIRGVFSNCIMSQDKKILFMKNSKAGCTSIAQMIIHYSTGQFSENPHIHQAGVYQGLLRQKELREGFVDPKTYCFSISRDPIDRMLSAFFNFFIDENGRYAQKYLDAIKQRGFIDGGDLLKNFEVFVSFVEESLLVSRLYADPHWREQHVNMGLGFLNYNYIAKIENYNDDIQKVFDEADIGECLKTLDWKKKFNASSRRKLELPKSTISKIQTLYAKDFEVFGY